MKLLLIETLPEACGTTWTKTTEYEGKNPICAHIWADNIITSRLDVPTEDPEFLSGKILRFRNLIPRVV